MAADNGDNVDPAPQPGRKPKRKYKPITIPKPIDVPDSCMTTPKGGLPSPWMKLGHEMGLNLTAPRTPNLENHQGIPKPAGQPSENASHVSSKAASSKKSLPSKQKGGAPAPPPSTPKKPKKAEAKNKTPSNRVHDDASDGDISHWPSTRRSSTTRTTHRFHPYPDNEDSYRPMQVRDGYSPAEEAYQYGAGDDDEDDEYATTYDGEDTDARRRRY